MRVGWVEVQDEVSVRAGMGWISQSENSQTGHARVNVFDASDSRIHPDPPASRSRSGTL